MLKRNVTLAKFYFHIHPLRLSRKEEAIEGGVQTDNRGLTGAMGVNRVQADMDTERQKNKFILCPMFWLSQCDLTK